MEERDEIEILPELTDERRELLTSFQAISGMTDESQCAQILETFHWNLENAVNAAVLGDIVPENEDIIPSELPVAQTGRSGNFGQQTSEPDILPSSLGSQGFGTPQRRRNNSSQNINAGSGSGNGGGILSSIGSMLEHAGERLLDKIDISSSSSLDTSFPEFYERSYPNIAHPPFSKASFKSCIDSSRRDQRMLFVYLHSELHHSIDRFCTETLSNPDLVSLLSSDQFIVHGASISSVEGTMTARQLQVTSFPYCSILLVRENGRIAQVFTSDSFLDADILTTAVRGVANHYGPILRERAMTRLHQEQSRSIREQQDREYEETLRADREMEEARRREEEQQREAQREVERREEEEREKLRARIANAESAISGISEPNPDEPNVRIAIRLPDGTQIRRLFPPLTHPDFLFHFIDFQASRPDASPGISSLLHCKFKLVANYPWREVKRLLPQDASLESLGFAPEGMLFVQECDPDSPVGNGPVSIQ